MSALGKVLSEPGRDFRQLFQRSQSSAEHGPQIQASEADPRPESLGIIGIQFKKLSNQSLRNPGRRQVHSVQSAKHNAAHAKAYDGH